MTQRSENPSTPKGTWTKNDTYMDIWRQAVEELLGRPLTGNLVEVRGIASWTGEQSLVQSNYMAGRTVEEFVRFVKNNK